MQLKHFKIWMYADDKKLYLDSFITSINTGVNDLNTDLRTFLFGDCKWFKDKSSKVKMLVIRKKSAKIEPSIDVFLADSKIDIVNFRQKSWRGFQQ